MRMAMVAAAMPSAAHLCQPCWRTPPVSGRKHVPKTSLISSSRVWVVPLSRSRGTSLGSTADKNLWSFGPPWTVLATPQRYERKLSADASCHMGTWRQNSWLSKTARNGTLPAGEGGEVVAELTGASLGTTPSAAAT